MPHHFSLPLDRRMSSAVNDVLACPFKSGARRAFVRSRYLEILALIYNAAIELPVNGQGAGVTLSLGTAESVALAASILADRLDRMGSLAEIAP